MKKKVEKRNKKRRIEELKDRNISLQTGMVLWVVLGLIFVWTIILPIIFFKFYKKYQREKEANVMEIQQLSSEITA